MKGKSSKSNSTYFIALRKRLDALGYGDLPLGLDSAPLAQQMIEDIFATTESLKESEEQLEKVKANATLLEAQLEPLQAENVRLTRENTQLHQLLIKSKEDLVKQDNQFSMSSFELNAENRRMKLLNQKTHEQVVNLQKQLEITNAKLKEALEAPALSGISDLTSGESSRRTKRSARSRRNGSGSISIDGQSVLSAPDEAEIKALKDEIASLKATVEAKDKEISIYNSKLTEANDIIKIKDEEIIRIGAELERETGRNGYIITLRHKFAQQELELEKLRAQLRVAASARSSIGRPRRFVRTNPKPVISINLTTNEEMKFSSAISFVSSAQSTPSRSDKSSLQNDDSINSSDDDSFIQKPVKQPQPQHQQQQQPQQPPKKTVSMESIKSTQAQEQAQKQLEETQKLLLDKTNELAQAEEAIKKLQAENEAQLDKIGELTASLAFVGDNFKSAIKSKDGEIQKLKAEIENLQKKAAELVESAKKQKDEEVRLVAEQQTKPLEQIAKQLEETRAEFTERIKVKKAKIAELRGRIAELSKPKEIPPCKDCPVHKQKIEQLEKELQIAKQQKAETDALQNHIKQLEGLLHAADDEKDLHKDDAAKLAEALVKNGSLEAELAEANQKLANAAKDVEKMKLRVEESEKLSSTVPDIQQRCRVMMEQAKAENCALQDEIKAKTDFIQELNSRYIECQKLNRKFQQQAQKAQEEAQNMRDEAKFHRTKNEEVQQIATNKLQTLQTESTATINQLRREVQQKTNEIDGLQKVLLRTRADIAPLTEVQIPQLKEQVLRLQRERQELAIRIKSLCELAQFAEKTTEFSPNSIAFVKALHHFNDEVRPFL